MMPGYLPLPLRGNASEMPSLDRYTQLIWALGMGALFFLVYGQVNAFTETRGALPRLAMPWEHHIPFIPWFIVPYISLDIFFVLSFFQLKNRTELHRHTLRLGTAILVSAGLFLIYPMQFGSPRPSSSGLPHLLFEALSLDLPYNQCPSLHIALALILWPVIRRMAKGWLQSLLAVWFVLIALSTLFTYQHHVIDLLGGVIAGLFVLQAIPLRDAHATPVNSAARRVASRYGVLSIAFLAGAITFGGRWLSLLYPFVTFGLVTTAYLTGRPDYLSKRNGRHCLVVKLLFGPFLIGQWASWYLLSRNQTPWIKITHSLYAGRRPTASEVRALQDQGIKTVIDLAPEVRESAKWKEIRYLHVPWLDLVPPAPEQRKSVTVLINQALSEGPVYLHCTLGRGRSMLAAVDWLVGQGLPRTEATEQLAQQRSIAIPTNCPPSRTLINEEETGHD